MTFLLAISSLVSRLLGILRNHALANAFGATGLSDAYFAAFQIPDTLYRFFVFGAISASFVPLFLSLVKGHREQAFRFASSVMNLFTLGIGVLSVLLFLFATPITSLLYPEFSPELLSTTSDLLRIMLLSPIFFTISSVFSGIQNSFRSFYGFALAPIVYNLGILFGIYVLAPIVGIVGVSYGVILGSLLHVVVQIPFTRKLGFRWEPLLEWTAPVKRLFILSIPRVFSLVGLQLMFFVEGIIATALLPGNLTVLRFAQDIQSFPVGIIGVSIAISSFSVMTEFSMNGLPESLHRYVKEKVDHLLLLLIPASFGMFLLSAPTVTLLLGGGAFSEQAIRATADVLQILSLGIPFMALVPLLMRVFFSLHDTLRPMLVTLTAMVFNITLAILLARRFEVLGIAIAGSLTALFAVLILLLFLRLRYIQKISDLIPFPALLIYTLASVIMMVFLQKLIGTFAFSIHMLPLFFEIIFFSALGVVTYFLILFLVFGKRLFGVLKNIAG